MKGKYRSVFVIPSNAHRVLGDSGWEFLSPDRIPKGIVDALISNLMLIETDSYLEMKEFSGDHVKAVVSLDLQGQVEHVYIRAYADRDIESELRDALSALDGCAGIEIFSPHSP